MARLVHDRDGRQWSVGTVVHRRDPDAEAVTAETTDRVLGRLLLGVCVALVLVVYLTVPASLPVPGVLGPVVALLVALAALLWWLRLARTVFADAGDSLELGDGWHTERTVRGPRAARREVHAVTSRLQAHTSDPDRDLAGDLPHSS